MQVTEGHYGAYLAEGQAAQPEWHVFDQRARVVPLEKCKNKLKVQNIVL